MRDTIFITIDCWRADAPLRMPNLEAQTQYWNTTNVITAGAATNGVFPALLASQYPDAVYTDDGNVSESVRTVADVFSDHGYSTGGFIASNPFLGKWSNYFGTFWNDGMTASSETDTTSGSKLMHFAKLTPRVTDKRVLERAYSWWHSQDHPRFCWIHLMGPHAPYYPGFLRASKQGLLRSYGSIASYSKWREDLPEFLHGDIKELYYQCIERLDQTLTDWVNSLKGKERILITGDHGEEFNHGIYGHARLFDETVRTPLYANNIDIGSRLVKQQDIPQLLIDHLNESPDNWIGNAERDTFGHQIMLNEAPSRGYRWVGIRTLQKKFIQRYDMEGNLEEESGYLIESDPEECRPVKVEPEFIELRQQVESFLSETISFKAQKSTGITKNVKDRLGELGYR